MNTVQNPIKRIYLEDSNYPHIKIEVDLPESFVNHHGEKIKKLTFKSNEYFDENDGDKIFDILMKTFGITLQKADLTGVTFVNMFCSDKDAKLSENPQPLPKPKDSGVLL